jgi:hypothetical protein
MNDRPFGEVDVLVGFLKGLITGAAVVGAIWLICWWVGGAG